jgi:hypothetical protein
MARGVQALGGALKRNRPTRRHATVADAPYQNRRSG